MNKKVVAIVGTYRKGKVIDSIVTELLRGAEEKGCTAEKIYLIDKHIEFCTNCRACCQKDNVPVRQQCVHNDDVEEILKKIEDADCVVFASPVNFGSVTAIMKRFIERLTVYAYWPWDIGAPKYRIKRCTKEAILVTSSACPECLAKLTFMYKPVFAVMKKAVRCFGAKVTKKISLGLVAMSEDGRITQNALKRAYNAGRQIA